MKQLLLVALVLLSFNVQAQEEGRRQKEERRENMKNISAEDMAELKTKKMTLHLDLTDEQQAKVKQLMLQEAKERKAQMTKHEEMKAKGEKPNQEQRIEHQKARLDKQIEMKKQLKSILSAEQYAKLDEILQRRNHKGKKRRH